MSTLWGNGSSFVNWMVNASPAGAARQFLSNAVFSAVTSIAAPLGWQGRAVPVALGWAVTLGWASVGSGWARTRPPVGDTATSRLVLVASNQARARVFPSDETAMPGLEPASLP